MVFAADNLMGRTIRGLLVLLLVGVVVTLGQLSVRPDWHAAIHSLLSASSHVDTADSDQNQELPNNEAGCAIELYGSGGFHWVASNLAVPAPSSTGLQSFFPRPDTPQVSDPRLTPPERAPPFFIA